MRQYMQISNEGLSNTNTSFMKIDLKILWLWPGISSIKYLCLFFIENTFFLKRHQEIRASGTTLVDFHFEVSSGLLDIQSQFLTRREFFSGILLWNKLWGSESEHLILQMAFFEALLIVYSKPRLTTTVLPMIYSMWIDQRYQLLLMLSHPPVRQWPIQRKKVIAIFKSFNDDYNCTWTYA